MSTVLQALETLRAALDSEAGPIVDDLWLDFARVKSHELASWQTDVGRSRHVLAFFGKMRAGRLTLADVDRYRAKRRGEKTERGGRDVSPAQRNREVTLLVRILNFAVERRSLAANPIAAAEAEPEDNVRAGRIGSEDELGRLLDACTPVLAAFALLLFDHGMRRGEGAGLRWAQIGTDGWVTLTKTKGRRHRRVKLTLRTVDAVFALPKLSPWVLTNPKTKKAYHPDTLGGWLADALEAAGLVGPDGERLTPHSLRHSFVYVARRRRKLAERTIMQMGGWKTRSAFDRYGIVDEEETAEAWDAMNEGARVGPKKAPASGVAAEFSRHRSRDVA